jgi:ABC-type glycerol-3-phosphate transport system substrate-binding protein
MGKMKVLKFAAVVFCAVLLFTFVGLAGCSAQKSDSATQAAWSITIKDSSAKEVQWTNEDAGKLEMVEVSAELEKKDGTKD